MCGINGCTWGDVELVKKMNRAVVHRGPDDHGLEQIGNIVLGHVRLSIIDLSKAGHQPMYYEKAGGACSATHRK